MVIATMVVRGQKSGIPDNPGDGLPMPGDDPYNGEYDDPNRGQDTGPDMPYDPDNDPSIPVVSRPHLTTNHHDTGDGSSLHNASQADCGDMGRVISGPVAGHGPATVVDGHLVLPDGKGMVEVPSFQADGHGGPWHVHAVYRSDTPVVSPPVNHAWERLDVPPLVPAALMEQYLGVRKDSFFADIGNNFVDAGMMPNHFNLLQGQNHSLTAAPKLGDVALNHSDDGSTGIRPQIKHMPLA